MTEPSLDVSALWGEEGELWDPQGRLPDYSYAGYHSGMKIIPESEVVSNVCDFGAAGDGQTDDTEAFKTAIAAAENGAVFVPAGRYCISGLVSINKSNIVLRGEGPEKTSLVFKKSLTELFGSMNYGYEGQNAPWNWGQGGLVWLGRPYKYNPAGAGLTNISGSVKRGDRVIEAVSSDSLKPGQWVSLILEDDVPKSLSAHLHNNQLDNASVHTDYEHVLKLEWYVQIEKVAGKQVTLVGRLHQYNSIYESGLEDMRLEMPDIPMCGHLLEMGFNGINFCGARNCWARNIEIANC
ncbi:MAG: glycosyl hydrolase family 28-related protein, partial [Planctomycetota bacterium]